jgi:hypothetical protein
MAESLVDPTGLPATLLDPLWERLDGQAVAAGRVSGRCPVRGAPGQIELFYGKLEDRKEESRHKDDVVPGSSAGSNTIYCVVERRNSLLEIPVSLGRENLEDCRVVSVVCWSCVPHESVAFGEPSA